MCDRKRRLGMSRRGKTSLAEDAMDRVALSPWWVGVVLALVNYPVLHSVALQLVGTTASLG